MSYNLPPNSKLLNEDSCILCNEYALYQMDPDTNPRESHQVFCAACNKCSKYNKNLTPDNLCKCFCTICGQPNTISDSINEDDQHECTGIIKPNLLSIFE